MRNKITDLNDHLFAQLERLANEDLTPEAMGSEVQRTNAIVAAADQITRNLDLQLKAARLFADHGEKMLPHLPLIGKSE